MRRTLVGQRNPRPGVGLAFGLAAAIGAVSGVLVAPITTMYYDSGLMIGLKGFVGAILGGMGSYPLAAAGALVVGLLESFASFLSSAYRDALVFALVIPILLWRNRGGAAHDE